MVDKFKDYQWDSFHDVIFNVTDKFDYTRTELEAIYEKLPEDIKADARHWGLSDTVVRDHIYVWLQGNLPLIK